MAQTLTSVRSFMKAAALAGALAVSTSACTSIARLKGGEVFLLPGPFLWVVPATVDPVPIDEPGRNTSVKAEAEPGLR